MVDSRSAVRWLRFRRRASRTPYGAEDACLGDWPRPLSLTLGKKKPKRFLYVTKESFLRLWSRVTSLPEDVAIYCQGGIPTRPYCEVLSHQARRSGRPLFFIGDLDPLDLTIFAALQSGNADLRRSSSTAVPVRYLGIDDRWLRLCREHLHPRWGLDAITIRMRETELEHFEIVKQILPDLGRLVGPECLALLESGRKLELEGASHPGHFRKPFGPALASLLLRSSGQRS